MHCLYWARNTLFKPRRNEQKIAVDMCWCIFWNDISRMILSLLTEHLFVASLHWCHNDHDGVSNHQPHHCLLNRLFRRISKKTSKLRVTGLCVGNSPGPVNSPHKGPVTRKIFPFDDVIMICEILIITDITHWGRDKMAAISQTTLSSAFSWEKMSEFRLKFHWTLFRRVQLTLFQHCFR